MGHLVSQYGEFIHLHFRLVLAVDRTMSNHSGSSDHVGGHAITDKHDYVLRLADFFEILDGPGCSGLLAIVVGQNSLILSWLAQVYPTVSLGGDIDE